MKLRFIGDALDHWKGSVLGDLQQHGLLNNLRVDPMADDAAAWSDDDLGLYARLLRVGAAQVVQHSVSLVRDRRAYFAELRQGDLFLDPDVGIATRPVSGSTKVRYLMPDELGDLLRQSRARVVAVYQHIRAQRTRERVTRIMEAVRRHGDPSCCSYESSAVAMLFFSADGLRIGEIRSHFKGILGRHAHGRINLWPDSA